MNIPEKIKQLNPWFYEVNICGNYTTPGLYPLKRRLLNNKGLVDTEYLINRQICRSQLLLDEVIKRYDFTDKSLLDLGCNCCYWTSRYLVEGASSLVGVDGRERFIQQADLLLSCLGLREQSRLIRKNVEEVNFSMLPFTPFDFVLCSGILYHIKDYENLLKRISKVNKDCLVIDTRVMPQDTQFKEPRDLYFNAIEETRDKLTPSRDKLLKLLNTLGYDYEILTPTFKTVKGVEGSDNYNIGCRICIFCRKVK